VIDTIYEACVTEILNFKATVIGALLKFFLLIRERMHLHNT